MIHTYITHLFSTTRTFPRADCLPKLVYIRDVIKKLMGTLVELKILYADSRKWATITAAAFQSELSYRADRKKPLLRQRPLKDRVDFAKKKTPKNPKKPKHLKYSFAVTNNIV